MWDRREDDSLDKGGWVYLMCKQAVSLKEVCESVRLKKVKVMRKWERKSIVRDISSKLIEMLEVCWREG